MTDITPKLKDIQNNFAPMDMPINWDDVEGLNKAEDNANKREIFAQNAAPTKDYKEGDLWFDTDDNNTIYRANASLTWVSVKDGTISGKVTTFFQNAVPTALAAGDLWFDTDDKNKLYRATAAGDDEIKAGEWVAARDTDIAQALADAATAQSTADGKIVTFYQSSVPTATDAGDLWVDTDDGKVYRATSVGDDQITAGEWERIDAGQYPALIDALQTTNAPAEASATVGAKAGTNLKKSDDSVLGDADVVTAEGTAAAIASQGALATKNAVDLATAEVTNKSLANVDSAADTKLTGVETGATVGATAGTDLKDSSLNVLDDDDIIRLLQYLYGDASDGIVSITSNTSLTRDMYYDDLTISNNAVLNPAGYRIFVQGTLTINSGSSIKRNGNNGSNGNTANSKTGAGGGVGGSALSAGYYPASEGGKAGQSGGDGASSSNGSAGSHGIGGDAVSNSVGSNGKNSGSSGAGGAASIYSGGSAGNVGYGGTATATSTAPRNHIDACQWIDNSNVGSPAKYTSSAGSGSSGGGGGGAGWMGGGGSADGGGGGGGGGSGSVGGSMGIFAKTIINNGAIESHGGDGGDGGGGMNGTQSGAGVAGGGGGAGAGAGGNGGLIIMVYNSYSGSGTKTVTGGTGGSLGSGGSGANGGGNGGDGSAGTNGDDGEILEFNN